MEERHYYLGFSAFPGIGPRRFTKLISTFKSAKVAWEASEKELIQVLGKITGIEFATFRDSFFLEEYAFQLEQKKIQFVTIVDKEYPKLLKDLQETQKIPFLLYVKGGVTNLNSPKSIGIVGTRKITPYGKEVTEMLTQQLVWNGFTIVSGLAFGVDALAHMTTIENRGKTIAVLGCGVDCCTPPSNRYIYDKILDSGGTIVSTFLPGQEASRGSFPARNATIAGLSLGILVTEGARDSGALITAEDAKKFGRPIFAVPGPITSNLSKGPNSLVSKGAVVVTSDEDIIRNLTIDNRELKMGKGDGKSKIDNQSSKEEREILNILESSSLHFDEIVRTIGKDSKTIGSLLIMMELKGIIKSDNSIYSLDL